MSLYVLMLLLCFPIFIDSLIGICDDGVVFYDYLFRTKGLDQEKATRDGATSHVVRKVNIFGFWILIGYYRRRGSGRYRLGSGSRWRTCGDLR